MATPRSAINQVFQIGTETAPGDGTGAAVNQLGTLGSQIAPVASGAFGMFRPSSGKYVGQVVPSDIYGEGPFTDTIDFNTQTFLYLGNMGFIPDAEGDPITTIAAGAYQYVFQPVPFGPSLTKTFVVQEGQTGAVYNYNNVCIPDLNMRFMRTGASQAGGRFLGRKQDPGGALTTATLRQGRAINGIKTGLWEADDWTSLLGGGAVRLDPVGIDLAVRHNGVFGPWFALDDSIESFAGILEGAIDAGFQITVLADVDEGLADIAGRFNFASMEDGEDIFLKVLNVGPIITGATPYSHEINIAGQISGPPRRSNAGNLRVWQWDCIFTPSWVTPYPVFRAILVNSLDPAALDVA